MARGTPILDCLAGRSLPFFSWPGERAAAETAQRALENMGEVASARTRNLTPTLRPRTADPPERPGLYVHRWMEMEPTALEEAVSLSGEAWESFEHEGAKVIGLFRETGEPEGVARLLLLTWYENFVAWEASRNRENHPKAWSNFRRRHELTRNVIAYATNLLLKQPSLHI